METILMRDIGKLTQLERVIWYMENFGQITPLDAMRDLGVMRLACVIHNARKAGYAIDDEYVEVKDRFGAKTHVKGYSLAA